MSINEILTKMIEIIDFSRRAKFKTIDLEVIALHEAQIELKQLLKNSSSEEIKEIYEYTKNLLNKFTDEKRIHHYIENKGRGFIIKPSGRSNIKEVEKFSLYFDIENDDIA